METESGFIIGALVTMFVTWIGVLQHRHTDKQKLKMLAALEYFENIPAQQLQEDMDEDIDAVAHQWTLLRLAINDPEKYKLYGDVYQTRIAAQLKTLETHEEVLAHRMMIGAGLNLGAIVDTKV